jgi:hypothetical protein
MRRFLPVMVLIVLAPLVAEVLPGSTPITMPGLLLIDLLIYGPGALLIRELVRRRGWASILFLGAAYGLIEEGLALQSLFNPAYNNVSLWGAHAFGINWVYAGVNIIWIHPIWSIAIPILLTELLFPARRVTPYLKRFGLIVTGIWYALGVAMVGFSARTSYPYTASPTLLGAVVLLVLVLVLVALFVLPRQVPRPQLPLNAPQPWVVLLVTGISAFIGLALPSSLWRVEPAFASFPLVLVPLLVPLVVAAAMIWLMQSFTQTRDWSDRHLLALASGALIAHTVVGGLIFSKTMARGVAIGALGLVMLILLALFALWVHRRADTLAESKAQTVVPEAMR